MNEQPLGAHSKPVSGKDPTRQDQLALYTIAYDEGKRTINDQLSELDSMRQRSVQFLAFIGSATAFLVGTSLKSVARPAEFYFVAVAATVLTLASVVLCILLLRASRKTFGKGDDWDFRVSPNRLLLWIEAEVGQPSSTDFVRALAVHYGKMIETNERALQAVRTRYMVFLLITVGQLILWLILAWFYG